MSEGESMLVQQELSKKERGAVKALAVSSCARVLKTPRLAEGERESAARDYIALAGALGVAPPLWGVYSYRDDLPDGQVRYEGVAAAIARQNDKDPAALRLLIEAGASPWVETIAHADRPKQGEWMALGLGDRYFESALKGQGEGFQRAETRSLILNGSLASAEPESRGAVIERFAERYQIGVASSSKRGRGVLGAADQEAKALAEMALSCQRAALPFEKKLPRKSRAALKKIAEDALERLAAKSAAPDPVADPETVKKNTTRAQERRIKGMVALLMECPGDKEAIQALFDASPWLRETPAMSCVAYGYGSSAKSLMETALVFKSAPALAALEAMGANIWLASAQAGEANACAWAAQKTSAFLQDKDDEPLDIHALARLLLKGAWLNGEPEPQASCIRMAREIPLGGHWGGALAIALEAQQISEAVGPGAVKKRPSL